MLVLKTSDHQEFTVEKSIAEQSITIKNMIEDLSETALVIPLPNVNSETLTIIIEYLKLHDSGTSKITGEVELKKHDKAFFDGVPWDKIFEVITAANYLNISGLLDISCQKAADHVKKMLVLKTSDHQVLIVEKSIAEQSITIKNMIEDLSKPASVIPLPNVNSETLKIIIEYLKFHESGTSKITGEEELEKHDKAFFDAVPWDNIFEVIEAANYLNIKGLLEISCQKVVDYIEGKSYLFVRKFFNVENDYTEEEEEAIVRRDYWAHEYVDSDDETKIGLASFNDLDV